MPHPPNLLNSLRVVIGQSKKFQIIIARRDGSKARLSSGARLIFSVARGGVVVFTKTTDDGGLEIMDRENGKAILNLEIEDTAQLQAGNSSYDLWVDHGGTPPKREPVVENAILFASNSVTQFSS